jgi:hypothetical protein
LELDFFKIFGLQVLTINSLSRCVFK